MSHLQDFVTRVGEKSPLQGKATSGVLSRLSADRKADDEALMEKLLEYASGVGLSMQDLVDSYLSICNNTRKEQIYFAKHGKYRLSEASDALEAVYDNEDVMRPYMLGLAVTQIFWEHHQALFGFFEKCVNDYDYENYLEIGPGHGLFLVESINRKPDANYTAIDLSQTSIDISKGMLETFLGSADKVDLLLADLFKWETDTRFDFIVVGEVLEHVMNPDVMLKKIGTFLNDGGRIWASTCANCPAIDHLYLFESAQHIRDIMMGAGFKIVDEVAVETQTGLCTRDGCPIPTTNYAALLEKA